MTLRIVHAADGCPSCGRPAFWEWHQDEPGRRSGGRWCPNQGCGYGIHPPQPELLAAP